MEKKWKIKEYSLTTGYRVKGIQMDLFKHFLHISIRKAQKNEMFLFQNTPPVKGYTQLGAKELE